MQKTQRKTIAFPTTIIDIIIYKAKKYDMDFTDYVRYLVTKDAIDEDKKRQEWLKKLPSIELNNETIARIKEVRKEYDTGKGVTFDNVEDLMEYIKGSDADENENEKIRN